MLQGGWSGGGLTNETGDFLNHNSCLRLATECLNAVVTDDVTLLALLQSHRRFDRLAAKSTFHCRLVLGHGLVAQHGLYFFNFRA